MKNSGQVSRTGFCVGVFILIGCLLAGCYTVPTTGRRTVNFISVGQETEMGAASFQQIKKEEKVSNDPILNERVTNVGKRIATAVGDDLPSAQWEFVVFDSPDINAFALPGGKVGVYTGLLALAESDAELATVMGHEIAHVTARHGSERMSQNILVAAGAVGVGVATKDQSNSERAAALAAYGLGTTVGVLLPYSRKHETEADIIGLQYAARAGYDPRAAITFWEKMAAASKGKNKPPEFLSTHPADETRIRELKKIMPEALAVYHPDGGDGN
ncbi:MAG: M48 family metallopeptidase [Opitutaceae bacterium]